MLFEGCAAHAVPISAGFLVGDGQYRLHPAVTAQSHIQVGCCPSQSRGLVLQSIAVCNRSVEDVDRCCGYVGGAGERQVPGTDRNPLCHDAAGAIVSCNHHWRTDQVERDGSKAP